MSIAQLTRTGNVTFEDLSSIAEAADANRQPQREAVDVIRRHATVAILSDGLLHGVYLRALEDIADLFSTLNPSAAAIWPYHHAHEAYVDAALAIICRDRLDRAATAVLAWPWQARWGVLPKLGDIQVPVARAA